MKHIYQIPLFICTITILTSCRKDAMKPNAVANINITNAVVDGEAVKVNCLNLSQFAVASGTSFINFIIPSGSQRLYVYPISDSLRPYYSRIVQADAGDIFSLFLSGQFPTVDTLLIKENIPSRTDSTFGLRFINLSPNAPAVNVTLSTSVTVNEFANIAYMGATEFKTYAAPASTTTSYTFQVRNAVNNIILASSTITGTTNTTGIPRFRNITLVLRGLVGGTGTSAIAITRVNQFN
jgi:enamine deaminase RidA (YjgF/YER057c/UK114 family)